MTNKDLLKEFLWIFLAYFISYILIISLIPANTFYLSDIYMGSRPRESYSLTTFLDPIAFALALYIFFPFLFIITTVRSLIKKFSQRSSTIFLLFITLISILSNSVILTLFKTVTTLFFGAWTFYPPLSAAMESSPPVWIDRGIYMLLIFIGIQILVFFVACIKVFGKREEIKKNG